MFLLEGFLLSVCNRQVLILLPPCYVRKSWVMRGPDNDIVEEWQASHFTVVDSDERCSSFDGNIPVALLVYKQAGVFIHYPIYKK